MGGGRHGTEVRRSMLSHGIHRIWLAVLTATIAIGLVGCADAGSPGGSTVISNTGRSIATPPPLKIGAEETSPPSASVLRLNEPGSATPSGAALILTSDGFLLTHTSTLGGNVRVTLPDGSSLRPIRVADDEPSGLVLLKIPTTDLSAIRLSEEAVSEGAEVFAAGWDESTPSFGEIAGRVQAASTVAETNEDEPEQIVTDIPAVPGFIGGALSDGSGAVLGILVEGVSEDGKKVLAAIPVEHFTTWIDSWRSEAQEIAAEGENWPVLLTELGVTLRYPDDWSMVSESGDESSYQGEITPRDPDVPLRLSISIQRLSEPVDPLAFVEREFGDAGNAILWGEVSHAGLPGVRLRMSQEGARVDLVYLFSDSLQIAVNMTSGFGVNDTGPAAQRATALFDALLESIEVERASHRNHNVTPVVGYTVCVCLEKSLSS